MKNASDTLIHMFSPCTPERGGRRWRSSNWPTSLQDHSITVAAQGMTGNPSGKGRTSCPMR